MEMCYVLVEHVHGKYYIFIHIMEILYFVLIQCYFISILLSRFHLPMPMFVACSSFYWHGLTLSNNNIHYKVWDEFTCPFTSFNELIVGLDK